MHRMQYKEMHANPFDCWFGVPLNSHLYKAPPAVIIPELYVYYCDICVFISSNRPSWRFTYSFHSLLLFWQCRWKNGGPEDGRWDYSPVKESKGKLPWQQLRVTCYSKTLQFLWLGRSPFSDISKLMFRCELQLVNMVHWFNQHQQGECWYVMKGIVMMYCE